MNVKHLLHKLRADVFLLAKLEERRDYLRMSSLPRGIHPKQITVQVSPDFDRMGDALAEAEDTLKKIEDVHKRIDRNRGVAKALICRAHNDKQRTALWLYFIQTTENARYPRPLSDDEAAGEMGISPVYLRVLVHRGIAAIQKTV